MVGGRVTDLEHDEQQLAEIVRLFPDADEHDDAQPGAVKAPAKSYCAHLRVSLDKEARRVYCRDCEAEVDAFGVILNWAQGWDRVTNWRKEAQRRSNLARDRLTELLRLEKNARTRLRKIDPAAEASVKRPHDHGMPM